MEDTKYEIDKQKRKQDLVRNEFLYNGKSAGKYDFPIIRKQDIDVEKIKLMSFSDAKPDDSKNRDFSHTIGNLKTFMKRRPTSWKN